MITKATEDRFLLVMGALYIALLGLIYDKPEWGKVALERIARK